MLCAYSTIPNEVDKLVHTPMCLWILQSEHHVGTEMPTAAVALQQSAGLDVGFGQDALSIGAAAQGLGVRLYGIDKGGIERSLFNTEQEHRQNYQ